MLSPQGRAVHVVCSPEGRLLDDHHGLCAGPGCVVGGFAREETVMECLHCKGRLVKGTAPFSVDRSGYHLHWDAIPAWVCTQCGEPLFEGREVDVIQGAIQALDRENEKLLVTR